MVIDRVEQIINTHFMAQDGFDVINEGQLQTIFKSIKESLKKIITKDTNATVRDHGVNLLGQFRMLLSLTGAPADYQEVEDVIKQLPKARINEINKRVEIFEEEAQRIRGSTPTPHHEAPLSSRGPRTQSS